MTDQPLISVPDLAPPLAVPGSGPGPSPSTAEYLQNGRRPHMVTTPEREELFEGPRYLAELTQEHPAHGMRGWLLLVMVGNTTEWPERRISRPAVRPPSPADRVAALAKLGFEPEHTLDEWTWHERTSFDGTVLLRADLVVRALPPTSTAAAAAAPVDEHLQEASA